MPRKSEALRLLELLDLADLRMFAQHHDLPHTGSATQLRRRLVEALGRQLEGIVSLRGPWSRENWNALVLKLGGESQQAFEDLRHEIRRLLVADDPGDDAGRTTPPPPVTAGTSPEPDPTPICSSGWALPAVGTLIKDRYRLRERLGAGGFGTVFSACDEEVGDDGVVLKFANDPAHAESVLHEYRKATALTHPNICNYKHFDRTAEYGPFVVMRNGGKSVGEMAKSTGLGVRAALAILHQAASALDFAHGEDVIHGDVNPGNILVDARGHAQLTDFGIATTAMRVAARDGHMTIQGTSVKGIHSLFGAPETHHLVLKRESDQYSLALVFIVMMKGMRGFRGPEQDLVGLSAGQRSALARALSYLFNERFKSCREFADAMGRPVRTHAE